MRTAPCKDCPDRKILCHGHCERYQQWKSDLADMMAKKPDDPGWNPRALRLYWKDLRWSRNNRR